MAAMTSAFSMAISNPGFCTSGGSSTSSRWRGVCSLHSTVALRRYHAVTYGDYYNKGRRFRRLQPYALAEQQQTEVKQAEEESNNGGLGVGENTESEATDTKTAATPESAPSTVSILLGSYREAIASNDESSMNDIQSQLETIEKETSSLTLVVANLTEEVSLSKERLLRLNADFDNFRKRTDREKDSLRENVKGDVVESLLPMIDNFERAKSSIKAETEAEKKIDSSYQSIYKQFVDIMKGLGVKVIDTVGKKFNPEIHEAIMREDSAEFLEGYIIQEFRRGFMIGEKLLRPAMVKVSAGKPSPTEAAKDETSENGEEAEANEAT